MIKTTSAQKWQKTITKCLNRTKSPSEKVEILVVTGISAVRAPRNTTVKEVARNIQTIMQTVVITMVTINMNLTINELGTYTNLVLNNLALMYEKAQKPYQIMQI